jgi:hypothetical protein
MSSLTAYDFACAMQDHWTTPKPLGGLGNVSSPKLMSLWSAMGQAFLGAIEASKNPSSPDRQLPHSTSTHFKGPPVNRWGPSLIQEGPRLCPRA